MNPRATTAQQSLKNFPTMAERKLRFCMITTFYPPYNFGGDGIFVRNLSNQLAQRGHHVEVIHCIDAYLSLAKVEPRAGYNDNPDVIVHGLRSRFGLLSPLATQQFGGPYLKSAKIRKILSRGFDVIHYHNVSLVGGPQILAFGDAVKLYTMHEYWLVCPTHMLFKYNREPCVERQCLRCTLAHKRPPQWWRYTDLLDRATRHVDAFIAPSRFSKEIHDKELRRPAVHLPYFVPRSELELGADPIPARQPPYFLFVGRLEALKGVQTLIPLFRSYDRAQLWIAGTGEYENELKQMAQGCDNIRFCGFQSGPKLDSLYRGATALIVPTLYYEIFGLVIVEAFRQRKPVIVRNLGGMPELVRESNGGIIYESDHDLRAAVEQFVMHPMLGRELGQRGYDYYLENWVPEVYLEKYLGLIDSLAARRAAAPAASQTSGPERC